MVNFRSCSVVWRDSTSLRHLCCAFFFGRGYQNQQHLKSPCFQFLILEVPPLLNAMKITHATPLGATNEAIRVV